MAPPASVLTDLADSILYVSALLLDQPRPIDRVIDYFGEGRPGAAGGYARK
jgi:hypothetical protein